MENGDFGYHATIDAVLMDMDGDGVIRANGGFYGGYAGPSEVLELTIRFFQDSMQIASYTNVAVSGAMVDYPFLYFEWEIGAAELSSWDLGADPGVFCFGGPAVTPFDGSYFIDQVTGVLGNADAIGREFEFDVLEQGPVVSDPEPVDISFIVGADIRAGGSRLAAMRSGGGSSFQSFDLSNPVLPAAGGTLQLSGTRAIRFVTEDRLACVQRLQFGNFASIVSIDDSANPSLFVDIQMNSDDESPVDVGYVQGHVYVWDDFETRIYELIGPSNAPLVAVLPFPIDGGVSFLASDLEVVDSSALVTAGTELRVYDVSNPTTPVQVTAVPYPVGLTNWGWGSGGRTRSLAIDNDLAVVRSIDTNAGGEQVLLLYDVRDPTAPTLLGEVRPGGFVERFGYVRDRLVVERSDGSITSYDISDLSMPIVDPEFPTELSSPLDPFGDVLYAKKSGINSIVAVDLNTRVHRTPTPTGDAQNLVASGGFVFAADFDGGLAVVDPSVAISDRVVGHLPLPSSAIDIARSNEALLLCGLDSVSAVDATDPYAPVLLDTIALDGAITQCIDAFGTMAYAWSSDLRVHVIDASMPGTLLSPGSVVTGDSSGTMVAGPSGFFIVEQTPVAGEDPITEIVAYDAADPASPVRSGSVRTAGPVGALAFADGLLYAMGSDDNPDAGGGSLEVFDVTDPAGMVRVSRTELRVRGKAITYDGGFLYVATQDGELIVLDAGSGCWPVPVLRATIPNFDSKTLQAAGDFVYMTEAGAVVAFGLSDRCIGLDTDGNGTPDPCEPVQNLTRGTGYGLIQDAVLDALDGDVIEVAAGTHPASNIVFPNGIDIVLRGRGAGVTILDGSGVPGAGPVLDLRGSGQTAATVIRDLTIWRGANDDTVGGGGARIDSTSPTFICVEFRENAGPGNGGGAAHVLSTGTAIPTFDRCVFTEGRDAYDAFGAAGAGVVIMTQCLVADNDTEQGVRLDTNINLLVSNTIVHRAFSGRAVVVVGGGADITNSVFGGTVDAFAGGTFSTDRCLYPGATGDSIDGVPTFVNESSGDYRLAAGSLGIDAGSVDELGLVVFDLNGNPRFLDDPATPDSGSGIVTYLDIGAFEGNPAPVRCLADITGDDVLDLDDIDGFVTLFLAGNLSANLDGNDKLNLDDIDLFVASFLVGCP